MADRRPVLILLGSSLEDAAARRPERRTTRREIDTIEGSTVASGYGMLKGSGLEALCGKGTGAE